MANVYVNSDVQAGKISSGGTVSGVKSFHATVAWSVASTDAAGTIYRVFPNVPSDAIVTSLDIMNGAVTGASGALIGLYVPSEFGSGIIGSGNQFHTGFDLSSANAIAGGYVNAMPAVSILNRDNQLWDLAGQVQYPTSTTGPKAPAYDICLTMVNKTTVATGDICMRLKYIRGV